jgi:hypothetical protein
LAPESKTARQEFEAAKRNSLQTETTLEQIGGLWNGCFLDPGGGVFGLYKKCAFQKMSQSTVGRTKSIDKQCTMLSMQSIYAEDQTGNSSAGPPGMQDGIDAV